jgi:hypothetical protein
MWQGWNRSGRIGPDQLEGLNRPVFAGFWRFKIFLFNKFLLGQPQALVRNELYKFLDMEFFLSKVCRVQVQVQLTLLQ